MEAEGKSCQLSDTLAKFPSAGAQNFNSASKVGDFQILYLFREKFSDKQLFPTCQKFQGPLPPCHNLNGKINDLAMTGRMCSRCSIDNL